MDTLTIKSINAASAKMNHRLLRPLPRLATAFWAILLMLGGVAQCRAQSAPADKLPNIADSWQGKFQSKQDFRILVKISKGDAGYSAVVYSIDQGLTLPVARITFDGSTLKMTLETQPVTYEGTLSVDAKTFTGTWKQGPNAIPLALVRATPETEWEIPEDPPNQPPVEATASLAFEVATFKPSPPDASFKGIRLSRHQFLAVNTNLNDLIIFAYGVHPKQVIGVPGWAETEKFDIQAVPNNEGLPTLDQWKLMVRKLLEDRCKLSFHHDEKELPVYALTVSKTGPKLTPSLGNSIGLPALGFRGKIGGDVSASNVTMGDFINFMTRNVKLDRPIVDKTGIQGRYDFELDWTPDDTQFGGRGETTPPTEGASTAPSLFTAVQEQLGLRLDANRAQVEVLAIDHIEKPSEN
jgi:uncharacterized protein (TIGR03435 family)